MILHRLGYSQDEIDAIIRALCDNAQTGARGEIHDRSGATMRSVGVIRGQRDVDAGGIKATVTIADPGHLQQEDYLQACLAVWVTVYVPKLGRWVEIPWCNGPITKADPDDTGGLLELVAVGKGDLCKSELRETRTLPKGLKLTDAIVRVLHEWVGIPYVAINIPDRVRTLPKDRDYPRGTSCLSVATELADALDMDFHFDANGKTLIRNLPGTPIFTFHGGNDQGDPTSIISAPQRSQSLRDSSGNYLPNWVIVHGHKAAKGSDGSDVFGEAVCDPQSLISAQQLQVGGVDNWHLSVIHNPHIRTDADANARARSAIRNAEDLAQAVTFDAAQLWVFDWGDCVAAHTTDFFSVFNLRNWSDTVGGDGDAALMTVNYKRRLTLAGTRVRPT